jgi:hypothetical protein
VSRLWIFEHDLVQARWGVLPLRRRGSRAHACPLNQRRRNDECCRTEHPNAAVVRRGYEASNTADIATLTELVDESVVWHTPGRSPISGDYQGRDAVFGQFGRYGGDTGGTFRANVEPRAI